MTEIRSPKILYVQFVNPAAYPPLEHSSLILAERGWKIVFLGIGAIGASALKLPNHANIVVRQLGGAPRGWRQKVHYLGFVVWCWWWTITWRPDVIYASDLLANPVAWLLGWWSRALLVYHEHDSPARGATTRLESLWRWFRVKLAKRADYFVLPNQKRLDFYREECQPRGTGFCIWNCPMVNEVGPARTNLPQSLRVLYHGSVNSERLPFSILDAVASLPATVELHVAGYTTLGALDYFDRLRDYADAIGLSSRLRIIGPVPMRHDLLEHCRQCDVGLAFMPSQSLDVNMTNMTGASNKAFDYLASGLALLVSDLPDWKMLFVDGGYALACNPQDAGSVANALRQYLENPTETRMRGEKGRQRVEFEWNYQTQFEPLLTELEQQLGIPSGPIPQGLQRTQAA